MDTQSAFNLVVRLDNVAVITIDVPDEKMNTRSHSEHGC